MFRGWGWRRIASPRAPQSRALDTPRVFFDVSVDRIVMKLALASAALLLARAANAATVGNEGFTVPPFKCFGEAAKSRYELTSAESDLSGATYDPETGHIFVVNNGDRKVYEISGSAYQYNTLVKTFDVSAHTLDLEGISALGNREFAITDENPAKIIKVKLNADGTVTGASTLSSGISPAAGANLGFEGVTKIGNDYYAVQEQNPAKLWKLTGGTAPIAAHSGDLKDTTGYEIRSVGGLTRGGDATDEVFMVVKSYKGPGRDTSESYLQAGIFRYKLSTNTVLERFGGEVCNMGQPEGLTFWKEGTKVKMLIVGETTQARIYEADVGCTDAIGDISNTMQTCEEKVQLTADCEKTKADGGCGWRRCDKSQTPHTKICTDDSAATQCTEAECMAHCTNSDFSAGTGTTCTHWAYDVAEKECYIFDGCENESFDLDYTLYAMQDPTCEKVRADHPNGCEQRRCDKTRSVHNKICTDDSAATQCTLDECEQKCKDHVDFTCTTYAYDTAEKECYLFETCENEQYDADYNTYVLIDPTCEAQRGTTDAPGCNQRRCDKSVTPHVKICVDDTPEQQCTKNECEIHCAAKTFTDIGDEAFCTHWAYDEVDKECYIFHGCVGEQYDDDYELFFQSYGDRVALQDTNAYLTAYPPPAAVSASPPPPYVVTDNSAASRLFTAAVIGIAAALVHL